jgi:hypothetical protein
LCVVFAKKLGKKLAKNFSLMTMKICQHHPKGSPHTHSKILKVLQLRKKNGLSSSMRLMFCKKIFQKSSSSSAPAQGQAAHTVNISGHGNFYGGYNL